MTEDSNLLRKFYLDGIPPAPRGLPQVEVTLDINGNGSLDVSARTQRSSTQATMQIESLFRRQ